MIDSLLSEPDMWGPVNHWANWTGKKLYLAVRVRAVESSVEFAEAFRKSLARRKLSQEFTHAVLSRVDAYRDQNTEAIWAAYQTRKQEEAEADRLRNEQERKAAADRQRREEAEDVEYRKKLGIDPWLEHELAPKRWFRPRGCVHLLTIEYVAQMIVHMSEAYFLNSPSSNVYELWIEGSHEVTPRSGDTKGVGMRVESREVDIRAIGRLMLLDFLLARGRYWWPTKLETKGILSRSDWTGLRAALSNQLGRQSLKDVNDPHGILATARKNGLCPECFGKPPECRANCPSGRHHMEINADRGQWYCGYCKMGGDVENLRRILSTR